MGMVVRSNIMALNANRQLGMNNTQVGKSLEKLSSGFRINRAGDDASGLAISEKMKAQIKGLETASANAQDGISLVQTAEGALTEVHDMLNRMVELATKSSNGTLQNEVDRDAIQSEVDALRDEINRIGDSTNFNGIKLLDGSLSSSGTPGKTATADFKLSTAAAGAEKETAATKNAFKTSVAAGAAFTAGELGNSMRFGVTVDLGNGTTKTVEVNIKYTTNASGEKVLVTKDGTEYGVASQTATSPTQPEITSALLGELNKNSVIKDNFKLTDDGSGMLNFEARQAGKTGVATISGVYEYATLPGAAEAATANMGVAMGDVGGTGITVWAEDAYKSIDTAKMKIYEPAGTDASGNSSKKFEDAVFEVDGKKFAFVDQNITAEQLGKLDKNINYIKVTTTGQVSADDAQAMADLIRQKTGANATTKDVSGNNTTEIMFKSGTTAGTVSGGLKLQIGDTGDDFNMVTVSVDDMRSKNLGVEGLAVKEADDARGSIEVIKTAINKVSTNRANLGALQNRLEHTINNLDVAAENMNSANSRIRDTDMARQMMDYTKMNVLTQAAQAMLAQANQQPQSILQLLQ